MTDQFRTQFSPIVANTPKLLREVHKIRYEVYCQELNYESVENCWSGLERDIYDQRSIHCLLMHRASGLYAGCVRLVLADPYQPEAPFPFENACHNDMLHNSIKPNKLTRYAFGEVSRLAVRAEFRKCPGSNQTVDKELSEQMKLVNEHRKYFPLIPVGLYLAATSVAMEIGLDDVFAMMEPRLSRHLRRYGFPSHQIGEVVEYHGKRAPFQIFREAVLSGLNTDIFELLQVIRSDIKRSLRYHYLSGQLLRNYSVG